MKSFLPFALMTFMVLPVGAQDDIKYLGESDESLIFGTGSTIIVKGDIVSGWTNWKQFNDSQTGKPGTVSEKLYSAQCSDRRLALKAVTEYEDASRSTVTKTLQAKPGEEEYYDAVPGTVGETIMKWLCTYKVKKPAKRKSINK